MLFYRKQTDLSGGELRKSEKIKVIVDNNPKLNYEKSSCWYPLRLLLIWLLALWVAIKKRIFGPNLKINTFWFDGVSKNCRIIKENAAGWKALDIIYNYFQRDKENIFTNFWLSIKNAQAVRNRLKLTKFLLMKNIESLSNKVREIRLISIASGSAQAVIEAIAEEKEKRILVKGILIDIDPTALDHAKKLAQRFGVEDKFLFINKTASAISEIGREFKPNLIEMVGFLEYRSKEKAIKLIKVIYQVLKKEGIFLVSHIAPNLEKFFLKEVINWPMKYRTLKELAKIISLGSFSLENCTFYAEPFKIHYIAECKKL